MDTAYIPVLNTVISSIISLAVAFGTWHVSMKKDREKQVDEVKSILDAHREEYLTGIRNVQDDITQVNASVQNQISIIEVKLDTLSDRVDKHNNVVEKTYKAAQDIAILQTEVSNIQSDVNNLKDK